MPRTIRGIIMGLIVATLTGGGDAAAEQAMTPIGARGQHAQEVN